jgi:hypothetical protein
VFAAADALGLIGSDYRVSSQPTSALDGMGSPVTLAGGTSGQKLPTALLDHEVQADSLDANGPLG